MSEVTIPFKEQFKDKMLSGIKCCTWRTKRYGSVGDTFEAFGQIFVLKAVHEAPMGVVPFHWVSEGFDSEREAIDFMIRLRPKTGYDEDYPGWHHWFEKEMSETS